MTWLLRRIRFSRLRFREEILANTVEHGEGLMLDHALRLANAQSELAKVRREIDGLVDPQDIVRGIIA